MSMSLCKDSHTVLSGFVQGALNPIRFCWFVSALEVVGVRIFVHYDGI